MKHLVKKTFLLFSCLMLFFLTSVFSAGGATYTGSISTSGFPGYLYATDNWANGSSMTWTVSDDSPSSYYWTYTYTFTVPEKDINRLIIGVSDDFMDSNIKGFSPTDNVGGDHVKTDIHSKRM